MQKWGFSAGFVAGFTTSELFHKLAKVVKETLKDYPLVEKIMEKFMLYKLNFYLN